MKNYVYNSEMVIDVSDLNFVKKVKNFSVHAGTSYHLGIGFKNVNKSTIFNFDSIEDRNVMFLGIVNEILKIKGK